MTIFINNGGNWNHICGDMRVNISGDNPGWEYPDGYAVVKEGWVNSGGTWYRFYPDYIGMRVTITWTSGHDLDTCLSYDDKRGGFFCGRDNGWSGDNQSLGSESYEFYGGECETFQICLLWYDAIGEGATVTVESTNGYYHSLFVTDIPLTAYPGSSNPARFSCACDTGTCLTFSFQ